MKMGYLIINEQVLLEGSEVLEARQFHGFNHR